MKCKGLRERRDVEFVDVSGPFVSIPIELFRTLLHWADTGKLLFERQQTKALYLALKAYGAAEAARQVKHVGSQKSLANTSTAPKAACSPSSCPMFPAGRPQEKN